MSYLNHSLHHVSKGQVGDVDVLRSELKGGQLTETVHTIKYGTSWCSNKLSSKLSSKLVPVQQAIVMYCSSPEDA